MAVQILESNISTMVVNERTCCVLYRGNMCSCGSGFRERFFRTNLSHFQSVITKLNRTVTWRKLLLVHRRVDGDGCGLQLQTTFANHLINVEEPGVTTRQRNDITQHYAGQIPLPFESVSSLTTSLLVSITTNDTDAIF